MVVLACPRMRAWPLAIALLGTACARNAVLEVELTVPPQPAGPPRFVVVQFETDDVGFEEDWRRSESYPGAPLGTEAEVLRYSVVSEDPSTVVLVKVHFCVSEDCSALEDARDRVPAIWYRLERSLYVGERTTWREEIAAVPLDPPSGATIVEKCAIEGCISTGSAASSFCRLSGAHYCE